MEWMAMAERWLATTSCSSRAIRARSAPTACLRSSSASSAVCSARNRSAAALSRWLRIISPEVVGTTSTPAQAAPTSSISGFRKAISRPAETSTLTTTEVRSTVRESRAEP